MSAPVRIRVIVAVLALVAAGAVAGVVYATRQDPAQPEVLCQKPATVIIPGVDSAHIAAVRAALAKPPRAAARELEALANENPGDPVVQYNDGAALFCAGYVNDAAVAFRRAKKAGRNTQYEIEADTILHPQFLQGSGYPPFVYAGHDALLVQGQIAQRNFHQHTAERLWARAAKLRPNEPEAQVAAAVGRFDMDDLNASFSRLGPLVKRFPRSQSVRFHLGLLLAWTGQAKQARTELTLARGLGSQTLMGRTAAKLLAGFAKSGTKGSIR
jgi:predicted Zn-dependent protease